MNTKYIFSPMLLFVGWISVLAANEDLSDSEKLIRTALASPAGHIWTLDVWTERLGGEDECISGIEWIFFSTGALKKRICSNNKAIYSHHQWSLAGNASEKFELIIDGKEHWLEILTNKISEPGYPPYDVLIAKIYEQRADPEVHVELIELSRASD